LPAVWKLLVDLRLARGVENPGAGSVERNSAVSITILPQDLNFLVHEILTTHAALRRLDLSKVNTALGGTIATVRLGFSKFSYIHL